MSKFRYVGEEPAFIDTGGVSPVLVQPGDTVDIDVQGRYVQTGAHGETPLFEAVKATGKKEG